MGRFKVRINSFNFNEAKAFSPKPEVFREQKSEYLSLMKAEHFILLRFLVFFKMSRFRKCGKIRPYVKKPSIKNIETFKF